MVRIRKGRGFPMMSNWFAGTLIVLGAIGWNTAFPADRGSATCSLMEAVLDPDHAGRYTFKSTVMGYERLLKSKSEFCTASLGPKEQASVRLVYEEFIDAQTAHENVSSGEKQFGDHRPGSIDNVAGQTVHWKGGGRGPITLTFLLENLFVTIYAAPVDQYAGVDAIRATQPYLRNQLRRLAAAVVRDRKSRGNE
jgi:hypothetical protein